MGCLYPSGSWPFHAFPHSTICLALQTWMERLRWIQSDLLYIFFELEVFKAMGIIRVPASLAHNFSSVLPSHLFNLYCWYSCQSMYCMRIRRFQYSTGTSLIFRTFICPFIFLHFTHSSFWEISAELETWGSVSGWCLYDQLESIWAAVSLLFNKLASSLTYIDCYIMLCQLWSEFLV